MTSQTPEGHSDEAKALIARLSQPMPLQARRELDVCVKMDHLAAALHGTRAVVTAALSRPGEMSPYASQAALRDGWKDGLAELETSFEKTDQLAQALIHSIKVMLALE